MRICLEQTKVRTSPYDAAPLMLLGQDNCQLIATREMREIWKDELMVSRNLLGWAIHGHMKN